MVQLIKKFSFWQIFDCRFKYHYDHSTFQSVQAFVAPLEKMLRKFQAPRSTSQATKLITLTRHYDGNGLSNHKRELSCAECRRWLPYLKQHQRWSWHRAINCLRCWHYLHYIASNVTLLTLFKQLSSKKAILLIHMKWWPKNTISKILKIQHGVIVWTDSKGFLIFTLFRAGSICWILAASRVLQQWHCGCPNQNSEVTFTTKYPTKWST